MVINEIERLKSVRKFEQYNFDLNKGLQDILVLATDICQTPVAFLTLIDADTQWFKVARGLDVFTMPRSTSFCQYTIQGTKPLMVTDPTKDERFCEIPLVKKKPNIRFYAGAPLATEDGQNIGTLCVFDDHSKTLTDNQLDLLNILAKQAIHLMELELCLKLLEEKATQVELRNKALSEIAFTQAHEFRGPLTTVLGFMNIIKDNEYNEPKEYLLLMEEAINRLDEKIHLVVKSTQMAEDIYQYQS